MGTGAAQRKADQMVDQDRAPGSRSDGSSAAADCYPIAGSPAGTGHESARPADPGGGGFGEPDTGPDHAYGSEIGIPPASGGPGYPSPSIAPYEPEPPPALG